MTDATTRMTMRATDGVNRITAATTRMTVAGAEVAL